MRFVRTKRLLESVNIDTETKKEVLTEIESISNSIKDVLKTIDGMKQKEDFSPTQRLVIDEIYGVLKQCTIKDENE